MDQYKKTLSDLQNDTVKVMQCLSRLLMSNSVPSGKGIDDYLCEVEHLCVKSRTVMENFRTKDIWDEQTEKNEKAIEIAGTLEVTQEGWLHITLNTLLPSCKYRVSSYISDTINRLLRTSSYDLPYFDKAFLAIVEYCNNENHNALDNDNKGWKMIPNALKGRVIEDDNQFILSIGLFSKLSDDTRCEIYVLPPEDGADFMEMLSDDTV